MEKILNLLLSVLINDAANYIGSVFSDLSELTLHIENTLWGMTPGQMVTILNTLQKICLGLCIAMIIFKFLKKGFETYVLWTDGDADADPILLTTCFFKALATVLAFPIVYSFFTEIVALSAEKIRLACVVPSSGQITISVSAGLFNTIGVFIALIMLIALYVQFLKRGVELFILRMAFPFGCLGLLDSDKAMYKAMTQKLIQCGATVVIQVALSQIAFSLIFSGHPIIGIGVVSATLATPKFLQEFVIQGTSGNISGNMYQAVKIFQIVKSSISK